jgi:hypothetical protein
VGRLLSANGSSLERRVASLELVRLDSMRASVKDYYRRKPSRAERGSAHQYATGSEKELYPEIAHILLSSPGVMLPELLRLLQTDAARRLLRSSFAGPWRAYRLSTVRPNRGWKGPRCFPGAAGKKAIADLGLFLDPSYDGPKQIRARRLLYFEIKSSDRHRHEVRQLRAHLKALDQETGPGIGFLAAIGGAFVELQHPRWLGHTTLESFLRRTLAAAQMEIRDATLAREIGALLQRKIS